MSGLTGSPLLRPAELLAFLTETFTSGLSTVRSPSPLPDMTTVATGRFHRRVFHPLDLQLASLHWFQTFTAHSFLACRPLRPRGVQHRYVPELRCRHGLRRLTTGSALPKLPQSVPRGLRISWLHWFASATACQVARPPLRIRLDRPAFGDFYFQAFNGSVSLSVAGYNYNSGWISLCWRDLHPLEWQLASLHDQNAKNSA